MIEIIRDEQGNIHGVIEYYIVNPDGSMNDTGDTIWINECEIAPQYQNNGCIKKFISILINKFPNVKAGYFHRLGKYPNRLPRLYTRKQWERRLGI